jgi:hypothetical protein
LGDHFCTVRGYEHDGLMDAAIIIIVNCYVIHRWIFDPGKNEGKTKQPKLSLA